MMSAKTVSNDTPAAPAAATNNNAAAPTTAGEAATDFQNLLAGTVPAAEPLLIGALPAPPLPQLLLVKAPATPTPGKTPTATAKGAAAPLPADVSPEDMLKILDAAATLLPEAGEGEAKPATQLPQELVAADEQTKSDDDILTEWLDAMIPAGVFAPQAGANNPGDSLQGQAGDAERKGGSAALSASLTRQALVPEQMNPIDVVPQSAAVSPGTNLNREVVAAGQSLVTAFAATLTGKAETTEKDKPSADGWMSALGDMAAKRGQDVVPNSGPRLSTPVHDPRWADALAHRLVMMARDGESSAQIKLVPQDLGPLDIQITVRDGEASVHFGAAHQETRAVLEASLPRLRELLGAQGLQLANASVSHQSAGQNRSERSTGTAAVGAVAEDTEVSKATAVNTSLLDIYA